MEIHRFSVKPVVWAIAVLVLLVAAAMACTGEQGSTGVAGPQGEQGSTGAAGPQGEQGSIGAAGDPAPPGQLQAMEAKVVQLEQQLGRQPGIGTQSMGVKWYEAHEGWEEGAFQTTHPGHQSGIAPTFEVRGFSTVERSDRGVTATLQASGLEQGAWTLWTIFYNHPDKCKHPMFGPDGRQISACSFSDRNTEGVDRNPGWGSGAVVDASGIGEFSVTRNVDDDSYIGTPPPGMPATFPLCCPVWTNPLGAEIHLLMRYHGPVVSELREAQLGSWGGGCSNQYDGFPNRGTAGDFECWDPSFAVHPGSVDFEGGSVGVRTVSQTN